MTAQMPDHVLYKGEDYRLIGHKGENLPTPYTFGLQPTMWHTACYRGYVATYTCETDELYLTRLRIGRLQKDAEWKDINGVSAETVFREGTVIRNGESKHERWEDGKQYTLHEPSYFSGGLLIGKGFIQALYVHMGFGKPYQFEEVYELLFHEGKLVNTVDHCEKAAQWREQVIRNNEEYRRKWQALKDEGLSGKEISERLNSTPDKDELMKGIEWRFSLDYDNWF